MTALEQIRALYKGLSLADQLSVMCDLVQVGHRDLHGTDAWCDALTPVDDAFSNAYQELLECADPFDTDAVDADRYWRDSHHAVAAGLGE